MPEGSRLPTPTLNELKRRGDEAFVEAQIVIEKAHQITRDARELRRALEHTTEELKVYTD
jgi:hypothetical protein